MSHGASFNSLTDSHWSRRPKSIKAPSHSFNSLTDSHKKKLLQIHRKGKYFQFLNGFSLYGKDNNYGYGTTFNSLTDSHNDKNHPNRK